MSRIKSSTSKEGKEPDGVLSLAVPVGSGSSWMVASAVVSIVVGETNISASVYMVDLTIIDVSSITSGEYVPSSKVEDVVEGVDSKFSTSIIELLSSLSDGLSVLVDNAGEGGEVSASCTYATAVRSVLVEIRIVGFVRGTKASLVKVSFVSFSVVVSSSVFTGVSATIKDAVARISSVSVSTVVVVSAFNFNSDKEDAVYDERSGLSWGFSRDDATAVVSALDEPDVIESV